MKTPSCAQLNRPDELITGRRSQDTTARCQSDGCKQIEEMSQPSGNLVSNNLEQTAINSVTRSMSLKDAKSVMTKLESMDRQQCRPCVQADSNLLTCQIPVNVHRTGHRSFSIPIPYRFPGRGWLRSGICVSPVARAPGGFLIRFPVRRSTLHLSQLDSVAQSDVLAQLTLTDAFVHFMSSSQPLSNSCIAIE